MLTHQLKTLITQWKAAPYMKWEAAPGIGGAYDKITARIAAKAGHIVQGGPYKRMRYFGPSGIPLEGREPASKLIGSFEEEIHPWIESLIARRFSQVIHIGGSDGYHAVGLLTRMPESCSVVFDTLIPARRAIKSLARQNGVHNRIQLRGYCGADAMRDLDMHDTLIFSDCGGAELTILDPHSHPGLKTATILVETHDAFDDRISPRIRSRFAATHRIEVKSAVDRDPMRYPFLEEFSPASAQLALREGRATTAVEARQTWMLLTPYTS
jgi:hypothetical protein